MRLNHKHIGTERLPLGLFREEKCFADQLLDEKDFTLYSVREEVQQSEPPLAELKQKRVANRTTQFAIYADDQPKENEKGQDMAPAEKLAQIQKRLDFIREENGARHRQ